MDYIGLFSRKLIFFREYTYNFFFTITIVTWKLAIYTRNIYTLPGVLTESRGYMYRGGEIYHVRRSE